MNGDIVSKLDPTAATTINNLKSTVSSLNTYNVTEKVNTLDSTLTDINTMISNRYTGKVADYDTATNTDVVNGMKKIAKASNYPTCTALATDSWAVAVGSDVAPCDLGSPTAYKTAATG